MNKDIPYFEKNIYNYTMFLIYLKNKKIDDCNQNERYVKDLLQK